MKNSLFMLVGLLSFAATAQTLPSSVHTASFEDDFFSAIDMKIFHDSQIMQGALLYLSEQQNTPMNAADGTRDKLTQGIFNEQDSEILESTMDAKKVSYNITPELVEKAGEDPFEAFKDLVRTSTVPKLTRQEMEKLNQVDDKAIPQMLQMATESGPDIGARPVSVIYGNEI